MATMLPVVAQPVQFAEKWNNQPSFVASPFSLEAANWTTPDAEDVINAGEMFAAVSKSALYSSVRWLQNTGHEQALYQAFFGFSTNGGGSGYPQVGFTPQFHAITTNNVLECPMPVQYWTSSSGFLPHTEYWAAVDLDGKKAFFSQIATETSNPLLYVEQVDGILDPSTQIMIWYHTGAKTWEFEQAASFSGGVQVIPLAQTGYYAVELTQASDSGSSDAHVTLTYETAAGGLFGISALPGIWDEFTNIKGIRVMAAAVQLTPSVSELANGGSVVGRQCTTASDWYGSMDGGSPFTNLNSENNSVKMKFNNGIYGFMLPRDVKDYDYQVPFIYASGGINGLYNPPPRGWLCIAAQAPPANGIGILPYSGAIATLSFLYGVEVQTDSYWRSTHLPTFSSEDFDMAMKALETVDQFHENPTHIRDMLKALKNGLGTALRAAPTLLGAARMFFPGLAVPAAALTAAQAIGSLI
jgi:hypothetical protein